ncbi:hypothetical protein BDN72DRAFT_845675 [Pluteus cervinus]|uniref:Uncharacterized protein n=1 Tax=Pluteus cervinus TaxID=181527 RepID=A0ACD3AI23_9AGAR|nr:hypothetical protein BDN72DRAFT_845675 [Pluteus cervinus]
MTSITRNLPPFIRDLGISIVGKKCYVSLVENLDIADVPCLKHAVSKGLGLGIVVGGSIVKLPQILLILGAHTAEGLSLTGYIFETLSYGITLAYSYTSQFPFSTYGENFFLTLQNLLISLLIVAYGSPTGGPSALSSFIQLSVLIGGLSALPFIPVDTLSKLQLFLALPLSLLSKLAQIQQNYEAKSTGQLSSFALGAQLLGCIVRVYTSLFEVGDINVAAGFLGALVLNVVLVGQVFAYYGQYPRRGQKETKGKKEKKVDAVPVTEGVQPEKIVTQQPQPIRAPVAAPVPVSAIPSAKIQAYETTRAASPVRRVATPPAQSQGANRKWARKVD